MGAVPPPQGETAQLCRSRSMCLIDAAAAAGVRHVILHSSLGASAPAKSLSPLQAARMGGRPHLLMRQELEDYLERNSERSTSSLELPRMRHTILQAAPYVTAIQLAERQRSSNKQESAEGSLTVEEPLSLTTPECCAMAAVRAALYAQPNTLRRRVTMQVIGDQVICP